MSKAYISKYLSHDEAEELIKKEWGDVQLIKRYFPMDDLVCWFIEEPDTYCQNYVAEMGPARLVIHDYCIKICEPVNS